MISQPRCKVVVDTNVFISGILFGGNPEKVLEQIRNQIILLCISPSIAVEIITKIKKFTQDDLVLKSLQSTITKNVLLVKPAKKVNICRDPKDNMYLEAVWESQADYLITGDKDLLTLKAFKKTKIVTPKEFLLHLV